MRRLAANPMTSIGALLCLLMVVAAVLAPWIAPYDPLDQHIIERLQPAGGDFLFGTDAYGRDVLSRILWGARIRGPERDLVSTLDGIMVAAAAAVPLATVDPGGSSAIMDPMPDLNVTDEPGTLELED